MKTKVQPTFLYEGLGFPVELENVEMININDEWHPKIDVHYVAGEIKKTGYARRGINRQSS